MAFQKPPFQPDAFAGLQVKPDADAFQRNAFEPNAFQIGHITAASTPGSSRLKYWTGSGWTSKTLKYWDGAAWQAKTLKAWNGSTWI